MQPADCLQSELIRTAKFDKAVTYYLVETKAPEGYQLDETKHEVTFTYVDDKTPVIEVIQKVTNEKLPEDTPSVSNPKQAMTPTSGFRPCA